MAKKIGLALSGGGMRGAAHIGLLKRLDEMDIKPHVIAGTSAGAIVGSLYAAGHSYPTILEFFKEQKLFDITHFTWTKPGFIDTDDYLEHMRPYFDEDRFDALNTKLYVLAAEILHGEMCIFESGELIKTVLASAAIPGVFSPVQIGDKLYVDGGVVNNFPSDILRDKCDFVIGMNVNAIPKVKPEDMGTTFSILRRVYEISSRKQALENEQYCDIAITPKDLVEYNEFNKKNIDAAFEIGYKEATKALEHF